jgi:hypothetical protein
MLISGLLLCQPQRAPAQTLALLLLLCGAACAAGATMQPEEQTTSEYVVPRELDASGGTDVTSQLQAFFDSVPDTSIIRFRSGARYRIDGTLVLRDRHGLTFDGRSATFVATTQADRRRRHWMFVRGSGIRIRSMTVVGANPYAGVSDQAYNADLEAQHGFDFQGVQGVELDSVTVTDVWGDFVYVGMDVSTWTWSKNVWIHDSHFDRNGRQGISVTGAEDVRIERNYIGNIRRSSIDLEPFDTRGGIRRLLVSNNHFGPGRLTFIASKGAAAPIDDITIEGNRVTGDKLTVTVVAPVGSRRSRFRILNNTSDMPFGSPEALMNFVRVDSIEIRGNVQPLAPLRQMTAVLAKESCGIVVKDNVFSGALKELVVEPFSNCP